VIPALLLCLPLAVVGGDRDPAAGEPGGPPLLILAAKVFTAGEQGTLNRAAVLIRDGRIEAVGAAGELAVPAGAEVLDLGDQWLVPGMVEPHSHAGGPGADLNDMVYLTNPDLDIEGAIAPHNRQLRDAVAGGVTSVLFIPGSGTNMGGFGILLKTWGDTVEDMVVRAPGSLKVAQAGNPEWYSWGVGRAMMNWNTRDTLERGLAWARAHARGEAPWSPFWRHFSGLADGSLPVSVHTQIYQVVLMTITMLDRDLGMDAFIDHGTFDGYKAAPEAVRLHVPVMNGPRQYWYDRSRARFQGCGAGWAEAVPDGLLLGYNTDAPVVPQEELPFQAAMAVRLGHDDPEAVLRGITVNPARVLHYDDQAGSIQPGRDADLAAWTGFPLDPRSRVEKTWIRGRLVYDARRDGRRF